MTALTEVLLRLALALRLATDRTVPSDVRVAACGWLLAYGFPEARGLPVPPPLPTWGQA